MQGKVYIEYQFREGPYGGANQFLKSLKDYFVQNDLYTDKKEDANFILINHTNISIDTLKLKKQCPDKIFVHRMDGPVSKHRKWSKALDKQSFFLDKMLCDGTVFQSRWTESSCKEIGYKQTGLVNVIHNAPDPLIFNRSDREENPTEDKIKLVATSWSNNWNKGFDILEYLDKKLDFSKYDFTFIGNSPIVFQNIKHIQPLDSENLAKELKKNDIYIAVSKSESCSNSLLEALNCGLAVVARNSGCYPEIIGDGGKIAMSTEEFPMQIDEVAANLSEYKEKVPYFDRKAAGEAYYKFMCDIKESINQGTTKKKKLSSVQILEWKLYVFYIKVYQKMVRILEKIL